jgi:hypothetical protein
MIASTFLNGGKDGMRLLKRRWAIATPVIAATYALYFYAFHRQVGYNNQVYSEQAYAKNHKMLRNLIIK